MNRDKGECSDLVSQGIFKFTGVIVFSYSVSIHFLSVANKVALLIGNKDYQHAQRLGELFHPINDVCDLTGRLLNMNGFKVSL